LRIAEARGYKLQLSNCDAAGYRVAAIPQQNGGRTMCADQTAVIKASTKGVTDCFANGEPVNSGEGLPTSQESSSRTCRLAADMRFDYNRNCAGFAGVRGYSSKRSHVSATLLIKPALRSTMRPHQQS